MLDNDNIIFYNLYSVKIEDENAKKENLSSR